MISKIKRRPSFAAGHALNNLPAISKVLYTDDRCELYSLGSTEKNETALFIIKNPETGASSENRLTGWWNAQVPHMLSIKEVIKPSVLPAKTIGAVLELHGRYMGDGPLQEMKQDSLKKLFLAMLDEVERGLTIQLYPDFNPSLMWLSNNEDTVCALLPRDGTLPSENDQVRIVATAFSRCVTGIEPAQLAGGVPALLRWSKYGGEELSRLVDRCLASPGSKAAITTIPGLKSALGRGNQDVHDSKDGSSSHQPLPSTSADGKGLNKVAGMHELKELLQREVVTPLRNPEPYKRYGLSIPNGILLYGPPGCGKTYIARQLAEELGSYFVEIIPSELASPYIHQSVIRIRELFDMAAEHAPAVVFIDEFEALVPSRSDLGGHQQYKAEEVNEFLAHLNSCADKNIFIIAATNRPEKIDPAIRRTGRLDKLIYVGPPDVVARREMLLLHLEGRPIASGLDLAALAAMLNGYSASDIQFLVNEAARNALQSGQDISIESFRVAMSKIQPSISPEIEKSYKSIEQRGI